MKSVGNWTLFKSTTTMESIRKWFYKPKKDDTSLLAQFFYADEALNLVAAELDSFDGRKDPERCSALVNHLRQCQDKVLSICNRIMDETIPGERANRDFRVKFPDDVMQENLAGQLWFGAECLAAGSSIMNRESESAAMRPLAKALTKALENVRNLLREQCLRGYSIVAQSNDLFVERVQEALKIFDRLFAEFELSYVSAMVPVKTPREYELQQLVVVLFSETLQRALQMKLLTQDLVDDYDPALMFTIPRLAIVSGLLIFPDGPLCLDRPPSDMSEMFRPFRTLLHKIRELLWTLNKKELFTLEKLLCSSEELDYSCSNGGHILESASFEKDVETDLPTSYPTVPDLDDFVTRFYIDYPNCKQFVTDFYSVALEKEKKLENGSEDKDVSVSWGNPEESEDETEWVGETSECETLVTEILSGEEITVNGSGGVENDLNACEGNSGVSGTSCSTSYTLNIQCNAVEKSSCSSDSSHNDTSQSEPSFLRSDHLQISLVSTLPFPSSSLIASDFAAPSQEYEAHLESPEEESCGSCGQRRGSTQDPSSGFLMANQVGHDIMMASTGSQAAMTRSLSRPSVSDGGSQEALSAATASLSTLLLSDEKGASGNSSGQPRADAEEDPSTQSPIDSGVGTVISGSDTGSFSDRSPETVPTDLVDSRGEPLKNGDQSSTIPGTRLNSLDLSESTSMNSSPVHSSPCRKRSENCDPESHKHSMQSCLVETSHPSNHSVCDKNLFSGSDSADKSEFVISGGCHNLVTCSEHEVTNSCDAQSSCRQENELKASNGSESEVYVHCSDNCVGEIREPHVADVWHSVAEIVPPAVHVSSTSEKEGPVPSVSHCSTSGCELLQPPRCSLMLSSPRGRINSPRLRNKSGMKVKERKRLNSSSRMVPGNPGSALEAPVIGSYSSSCSSCRSSITASSDSCSTSSDTSSFNSECQDDEEIALAMQAAEIANRNEARSKFRSSEDLVHRLFVCIAGVADQLQTNFAGDLRNILKSVFLMSAVITSGSTDDVREMDTQESEQDVSATSDLDCSRGVDSAEEAWEAPMSPGDLEPPPPWVPDGEAPRCMSCEAVFTVVRRRHHCRNCGKVFCARCSSNSVPLPRYGHVKPVRVCNRCFLYQVTPFTVEDASTTTRS